MKFLDVLQLGENEIIALVGAGGKTSTLYAIGEEAKQKGRKVILTTTTKIYYPIDLDISVVVSDDPDNLHDMINHALSIDNVVVVGKTVEAADDINSHPKLLGLDLDLFSSLQSTNADLIVVEADGAAGKPFKAPAGHEPMIPASSTIVMPIVGIDCIKQPLNAVTVHRADMIAQIAGMKAEDKITPEVVATVFTSELGYRKGLPSAVKWIPFINKVGQSSAELALAREIAVQIRQKILCTVLIGAAIEEDPLREVVGP